MVKIKRVYESVNEGDGYRILIDRLWPRGLSRNKAKIDLWLKEVAPSNSLRKWFAHDPDRWLKFKDSYFKELKGHGDYLRPIIMHGKNSTVTLLYGAKNERFNNAVALKEYVTRHRKALWD